MNNDKELILIAILLSVLFFIFGSWFGVVGCGYNMMNYFYGFGFMRILPLIFGIFLILAIIFFIKKLMEDKK